MPQGSGGDPVDQKLLPPPFALEIFLLLLNVTSSAPESELGVVSWELNMEPKPESARRLQKAAGDGIPSGQRQLLRDGPLLAMAKNNDWGHLGSAAMLAAQTAEARVQLEEPSEDSLLLEALAPCTCSLAHQLPGFRLAMDAMTSGHLTSLLMPGDGSGTTFLAEVLGAEPTATTYIVRCPAEGSTYAGCSMDLSVTLGPWASETLPAGAPSTGAVDWFATSVAGQDYAFSMHCDMTRSVAKACTLASIGGDGTDDATVNAAAVSVVTVTATRDLDLSGLHTWSYAPVLVTAGESLLTATSSASQDTSDAAPASDTAQATDASGTSDSGNSSGAVSCLGHGFAAISAAAIASIIILS